MWKAVNKETQIAVVGLGYVGLPLALGFDQADLPVIGYDIDETRIQELKEGKDRTGEAAAETLKKSR